MRQRKWRVHKRWRTGQTGQTGQSLEERAHVIGNRLYKESAILASYQWHRLFPLLHTNEQVRADRVRSLKQICAEKLARDVDLLEPQYLDFASWSCWKSVWENVLRLNHDSFRNYQMFSSKFGALKGFRPHKPNGLKPPKTLSTQELLEYTRSRAIELTVPPQASCYRLENLFSNAPISDLVRRLNKKAVVTTLVVLDISSARVSKDDCYLLFNLVNLIGLDISSSTTVDDSFIQNMATAIAVDGKLQKLQVLRAIGCPNITAKSMQILMLRCKYHYSMLSCIETHHNLDTVKISGKTYVVGSKWHLVDPSKELAIIPRLPLGLKIHMLHKYLGAQCNVASLSQTSVLDIQTSSLPYAENDLDSTLKLLLSTWNQRILARTREFTGFCYIFDRHHQLMSDTVTKSTSTRKPKKIVDAKKFFSM